MAEATRKPAKRPRQTLADHVVRQVREYIYSNGLKPGDRLPGEHEMAERLKISRATLREAIKGLTVSGLLEARPRTGTRVREFTYDRVVDAMVTHFHLSELRLGEVLEARAALELAAVPFAVQRITPAQIDEMREIERRFEAALIEGDHYNELDIALHEKLLEATGNRLLANMVGLLRAFFSHPLHRKLIVERRFDRDEQELTSREHRLLVDALAARDVAAATQVLHDHFWRQLSWLEADERVAPEP